MSTYDQTSYNDALSPLIVPKDKPANYFGERYSTLDAYIDKEEPLKLVPRVIEPSRKSPLLTISNERLSKGAKIKSHHLPSNVDIRDRFIEIKKNKKRVPVIDFSLRLDAYHSNKGCLHCDGDTNLKDYMFNYRMKGSNSLMKKSRNYFNKTIEARANSALK